VERMSCRNHVAPPNEIKNLEIDKNTGADNCKMEQADQPNIIRYDCRQKIEIKLATIVCILCIMFIIMHSLFFWKHVCRSRKPWYSLGQVVITFLLITHVVLVCALLSVTCLYDGKGKALQLGGTLLLCAVFAHVSIYKLSEK
jgi:magnesium-transporting ATPase (P-type)